MKIKKIIIPVVTAMMATAITGTAAMASGTQNGENNTAGNSAAKVQITLMDSSQKTIVGGNSNPAIEVNYDGNKYDGNNSSTDINQPTSKTAADAPSSAEIGKKKDVKDNEMGDSSGSSKESGDGDVKTQTDNKDRETAEGSDTKNDEKDNKKDKNSSSGQLSQKELTAQAAIDDATAAEMVAYVAGPDQIRDLTVDGLSMEDGILVYELSGTFADGAALTARVDANTAQVLSLHYDMEQS